ncbi:uncharacterized protein [Ptychodera flava]|uniref:uncharacterized protein isoform X2 n=1 Tax=Ptychodera flava TaxID=63121 RepID=UPI00396A82B5
MQDGLNWFVILPLRCLVLTSKMKISVVLMFGAILFLQEAGASSLGLQRRDEDDHHTTILGVTTDNEMVVLDEDGEWTDPIENSCCVLNVAVQPGGIVVGVGTDNQLYEWKSRGGEWSWVGPIENSCCVTSVRMASRGHLLGIGTDFKLMARSQLRGATWQRQPRGCCFRAVETTGDGTLYGLAKNNKIKSKIDIYTGNWRNVKIAGPEVKDIMYLDEDEITLGLSMDGCEIYQLDMDTMSWQSFVSLGDECLMSIGEGEGPVIELQGH